MKEQLQFLTRYRIAQSPSKLYMNKTKYIEETKFMSKLYNRPAQPGSILFQVLYPSLPRIDSTIVSPNVAKVSVLMKLVQQFRNLNLLYERSMMQRMKHATFKVTQLTFEEKTEIIALWLRGRKLLDLYQHYVKMKQKLVCTCEPCSQVRKDSLIARDRATDTVDHYTPLYAPLPLPILEGGNDLTGKKYALGKENGKGKAKFSNDIDGGGGGGGGVKTTNVWASSSISLVEDFHQAYASKVALIIESAVGQEQLKGTIQGLKVCCEGSTQQARQGSGVSRCDSVDNVLADRWVETLKQFRLVYSILLCEAQELNHCMFIKKVV